jgi:putative peptide zinc metalloprotease protein
VYDAAFALVWADDGEAMNVNEAQAYASCENCAAVAVAYQVVFVISEDDAEDNVVAPQNLAGALNYECANCLTYSVARQLFVTLDRPLSDEARAELDAVWAEIAAYGEAIEAGEVKDLDEIRPTLEGYTERIIAIVEADQPGTFATSSATSATSSATPTPSATPTVSSAPTSGTPAPSAAVATSGAAPQSSSAPEPSTGATVEQTDAGSTADPTADAGSTTGDSTTGDTTDSGSTSGDSTSGQDTSSGDTSSGDTGSG